MEIYVYFNVYLESDKSGYYDCFDLFLFLNTAAASRECLSCIILYLKSYYATHLIIIKNLHIYAQ